MTHNLARTGLEGSVGLWNTIVYPYSYTIKKWVDTWDWRVHSGDVQTLEFVVPDKRLGVLAQASRWMLPSQYLVEAEEEILVSMPGPKMVGSRKELPDRSQSQGRR